MLFTTWVACFTTRAVGVQARVDEVETVVVLAIVDVVVVEVVMFKRRTSNQEEILYCQSSRFLGLPLYGELDRELCTRHFLFLCYRRIGLMGKRTSHQYFSI